MVRLRLPGGRLPAAALSRLADLAGLYGNGILQLTSRAGLQVRGLPDPVPGAFVEEVGAAGLLPTATHERVRNIVTSPLTGLLGGGADLAPMITALDAALVAEPSLSELPGRFLFVLDDGRGDVIDLTFDLGYQATGPDRGVVLVGSAERGVPVRADEAVTTLVGLARGFAAARRATGAWHIRELAAWTQTLPLLPVRPVRGTPAVPLGRIGDAASVSVPLARLSADQVRVVTAVSAQGHLVVTPWRGLVIPGAAAALDQLQAVGLLGDEDSAWAQLSACVGAPFCSRARIDTDAVARAVAATNTPLPRTHLSGCERRCGAPAGDHLDLVAPTVADALRRLRP